MMNLNEILSRENARVTVEVDGERKEYTKNFIVMHMTDEGGEVLGCVSPIKLVKAMDMLINSIDDIMENMSPMDARIMAMMMCEMIKERIKREVMESEYEERSDEE